MSMGGSAGRSARNRTSGARRATQRERDLIDPPGRSDWERAEEAREVHASMVVVTYVVLLFLLLVLVFGIAAVYSAVT